MDGLNGLMRGFSGAQEGSEMVLWVLGAIFSFVVLSVNCFGVLGSEV